MKHFLISIFLSAWFLSLVEGLTSHLSAQSMVPEPSRRVLSPLTSQLECGEMLYRNPATYVAEFRNDAIEPIEIKFVDTGCGCTTATFTKGLIQPHSLAQVSLTFDCKQLGHFLRELRVAYTSSSMMSAKSDSVVYASMFLKGVVVTKKSDYSGEYPYHLGALLTDMEDLEFDDVNKGQRLSRDIHVFNPNGQNVSPTLLRLPAFLSAEMTPAVLPPNQKGIMRVTLNSNLLYDFGLNKTDIYLGKNSSDKASKDNMMTVTAVLLPPAVSQDDVNRPYAPKLSLSKDFIDMSPLKEKTRHKDEITISNNGRRPLEIQKLQLFTTGLDVTLNKQTIEPGESADLSVSCKASDLKKLHSRPRILMITNDPDHQKVVIEVKE